MDSPIVEAQHTDVKTERKAAIKAKNNLKNMIYAVKPKRSPFRHGWEEIDQDFSLDIVPFSSHGQDIQLEESTSNSTSPSTTPPSSPAVSVNSSTNLTSEDEEMAWDTSPEQYQLTIQKSLNAWSSPPFVPQPSSAVIPPAFPRKRINAVSYQPLTRRNAFRAPPADAPNNHPDPSSPHGRPTRIPVPVSPSQVDFTLVSDLSNVLPTLGMPQHAPRRSSRIRTPPVYLSAATNDDRKMEGKGNKEKPRKY